jgi:FkbM family methyltransferase
MDWHTACRRLGFDVIRWPLGTAVGIKLCELANAVQADTLVDVGANEGDLAKTVRARGFVGRIVAFEPAEASYRKLSACAADDPLWEVHKLALGSTTEERELKIAASSHMTSFLMPTKLARRAFGAEFSEVGRELVQVRRLDEIWEELVRGSRAVLKVDAQGWDRRVLEGATGVMERIVGIQTEVSLHAYYEGVPDYLETLQWLRDFGFEPSWISAVSAHDGVLDEADYLFRRRA